MTQDKSQALLIHDEKERKLNLFTVSENDLFRQISIVKCSQTEEEKIDRYLNQLKSNTQKHSRESATYKCEGREVI